IITLTVIIRFALWPLTTSQLKSTQKMAALKPHLDRIKSEHGHDKVRHQEEITKLYKEHNVNPLAGCLPLLLQLPVFFALYNVLNKVVTVNGDDFVNTINNQLYSSALHLDKTPSTSFLGYSLHNKPSEWQQIGILILLVPLLTGVFQFFQSKMIVAPAPKNALKKTGGKEDMEDTMAQVSSQMTLLMPVMIAFFSYGFPLGLSLYWNTFTIIGIFQQYVISGAGALNRYLPEKWKK
ncbi:MAG: YidC/Oxa1 family membrane protein insertase, partial [Candidatus Curtissbacteria bacterium]|nr:YidC/Oxa1 family membrane protein insertase [Candidatus Curtissbacteria bacterium]